jgi:hypothetical protein
MRLYANENFPLPAVQELRRLGHDVLTSADAGLAGQAVPDDQVLKFARDQERIILTLNRKHFLRLASEHPDHPGMILCTADRDFQGQAGRVHAALQGRDVLAGVVVRVNRPSS